jgi:hypothetical protein
MRHSHDKSVSILRIKDEQIAFYEKLLLEVEQEIQDKVSSDAELSRKVTQIQAVKGLGLLNDCHNALSNQRLPAVWQYPSGSQLCQSGCQDERIGSLQGTNTHLQTGEHPSEKLSVYARIECRT